MMRAECARKKSRGDGTTYVVFEPLDFMAYFAALVLTLPVNLARYHAEFVPHHRLRDQVTPNKR